MAYRIAGDYRSALAEAMEAEKRGYTWRESEQETKNVIEIINQLGEDPAVVLTEKDAEELESLLRVTQTNPNYLEAWIYLATTYANLGQFEKADEAAQKVIEIDPSLTPRVKEFLKTLPQK